MPAGRTGNPLTWDTAVLDAAAAAADHPPAPPTPPTLLSAAACLLSAAACAQDKGVKHLIRVAKIEYDDALLRQEGFILHASWAWPPLHR